MKYCHVLIVLIFIQLIASWFLIADVLRVVIKAGGDVSLPNYQGVTPVHIASHEGHVAVLRLLFRRQAGSDFFSKDNYCRTPLQMARDQGHQEVVDLILQIKARKRLSGNELFHLW